MSYKRPAHCCLPGCLRLNQRQTGDGYSPRYCKHHIEFYRRHGSYWFKSLAASELKPFRKASRTWLVHHREDFRVKAALDRIAALLETSGRAENAYSLRWLKADEKAKIALARLRNAKVPPSIILERIVAVTTCCEAKGIDERQREYRYVQLAKSVHRLASGTHKTTSGFPLPSKYPRSEGQMLRRLGEWLDDIAAFVMDGRYIAEGHPHE